MKKKELSKKLVDVITKDCSFKDYVNGKKLEPDAESAKELLKKHMASSVFDKRLNK